MDGPIEALFPLFHVWKDIRYVLLSLLKILIWGLAFNLMHNFDHYVLELSQITFAFFGIFDHVRTYPSLH